MSFQCLVGVCSLRGHDGQDRHFVTRWWWWRWGRWRCWWWTLWWCNCSTTDTLKDLKSPFTGLGNRNGLTYVTGFRFRICSEGRLTLVCRTYGPFWDISYIYDFLGISTIQKRKYAARHMHIEYFLMKFYFNDVIAERVAFDINANCIYTRVFTWHFPLIHFVGAVEVFIVLRTFI